MALQKIEVQRFSLTTSRPFDAVVASLKAGVGQLDLAAFANASKSQGAFAELEQVINRNMGKTGLMLFLEFDHGAVIRKETGLEQPKIVRLVIGNSLVMKEWPSMFRTQGHMRPSPFSWMSGPMACICPTTEWPAFWTHTKTWMP